MKGKRDEGADAQRGGEGRKHSLRSELAERIERQQSAASPLTLAALEVDGRDLRETLGIPKRLSAMGVGVDRLDEMVEMALRDPSCGGNPVPMDAAYTRALYDAAI